MPDRDVENFYDEHAKAYSAGGFPASRFKSRAAMSFADDITWHFMMKYLPDDKDIRILDAGGGDGYWAERFLELGYQNITISDISQVMLVQAKKRISRLDLQHNIEYIKSDIAAMDNIGSDAFDYVFSQYDAVSYCMRPQDAIHELCRVAKKGAHVLASLDTLYKRVPELIDAFLFDEAEKILQTKISHDYEFPQYNLTWEELAEFFEVAGLEVIEVIGAPVFMHQVSDKSRQFVEDDESIRERMLELELQHCTNRSLVNFAGHLMMVGQKPS